MSKGDGGGAPAQPTSVLLAQVESSDLTLFNCIALLPATADSVGLQYRLCQRLASFPRDHIGFYLPQLVHIFITVETEGAALEDFLIYMCNVSPHHTLVVFWYLQAALHDLDYAPRSYGFAVAKRLYNKLQWILFGVGSPPSSKMRENSHPALVLGGMIGAMLVPFAGKYVNDLVVCQGRRQRSSYLHRVITRRKSDPSLTEAMSRSHPYNNDISMSVPNFHHRPSYECAAEQLQHAKGPPEQQLKTHYFRCETQFVYALIAISNRLLHVPKEARLSALQLELALLNRDLPAEVDFPMLLPSYGNGKQHRIVRMAPSEATVLNSAEKAPYLLLVEYLRGDLTWDAKSPVNRKILERGTNGRLFERSNLLEKRGDPQPRPETPSEDEEQDIGQLSLVRLEESSPKYERQLPVSQPELEAATMFTELEGQDIADLATQMRTAAHILAQLDMSAEASRLPKAEIAQIRHKIVSSMQNMQHHEALVVGEAGERKLENDLKTSGLSNSNEDPSAANLGEDWQSRKRRIRQSSPFGHYPNWDLFSVIIKTGDDLRQEALASQLITHARHLWRAAGVDVWVKNMRIMIAGGNSGLVETITNALSLHSIKKALTSANVSDGGDPRHVAQLSQHFEHKFGPAGSARYARAVHNFVKSLAAYSLLCYLLQIKDRHNGNILVDNEGHIIHIDFGFMLSNAPGHIGFEASPFKLTYEYMELMGGQESQLFSEFVSLLKNAFKTLRQHADEFVTFVDIMSKESKLPCFMNGPQTAQQLRARFCLNLNDEEADQFVERLVFKSAGSFYTRLYDQFQLVTQGIYS